MTRKEFATFCMALKTYYSKEDKLIPNDKAMELWYQQLCDIPYEVAELALNKWVSTNKWSPSIAEIRATAAEITSGDIPDWGDGWEKVLLALRRYGSYNPAEAFKTFDEITLQCVKRIGWRELCFSENISVERANFRMLYEQLTERKRKERQMPINLFELIREKQADESKLLGNGE